MAASKWNTDNGTTIGKASCKRKTVVIQQEQETKRSSRTDKVEGKFGLGKNGYNLNKIRARLQKTSESSVACIFFIMNLIKYAGDFSLSQLLSFNLMIKQIITAKPCDSTEYNKILINFISPTDQMKFCNME